MNRLPEAADVHPRHYAQANERRMEQLGDLIDWLRVDVDMAGIADALSLSIGELDKLVKVAINNSVGGTNVVPHLLTTMDLLIFDLRVLKEKLR